MIERHVVPRTATKLVNDSHTPIVASNGKTFDLGACSPGVSLFSSSLPAPKRHAHRFRDPNQAGPEVSLCDRPTSSRQTEGRRHATARPYNSGDRAPISVFGSPLPRTLPHSTTPLFVETIQIPSHTSRLDAISDA